MSKETTEAGLIVVTPMASPRRNSTSNLVSPIPNSAPVVKEKALPRYLRASTGSCHDFCKYGRKHSFEVKGRHPFLLRKSDSNAASSKGDSTKGLKAIGARKSLVRLRGSSTKNVIPDENIKTEILEVQPSASATLPDESIKTEILEVQPSASATKDAKETEDVKRSIPVPESESSEGFEDIKGSIPVPESESSEESEDVNRSIPSLESESSEESEDRNRSILVPESESSEESVSIDGVGDTVSGTESIPSIVHDIHVVEKEVCSINVEVTETVEEVQEKEVCSVHAELTNMVEQVQETQSPTKKGDSAMDIKAREPETPAIKVTKSPVIPRIVKKDHLSVKKALEPVKPKVKREISSPASALPRVRVLKQTTPLVKKSDSSAKLATSLRSTAKAVKQIRPNMKSKSPSKPSGKLNTTPAFKSKSPSTLQRGPKNATPLLKSRPSPNSPSGLIATPPVKAKSTLSSPSGLSRTPSVKSKSPWSLSGRLNATPVLKSTSKPLRNPLRGIAKTNLENTLSRSSGLLKTEGKKISVSSRVDPSLRVSENQGPRTKLIKLGSLKTPVSLRNPGKLGARSSDEKVREKTIHVVEPKRSNPSLLRDASSRASRRASRHSSLSSLSSFLSRGGADELLDGSDHASNKDGRHYDLTKSMKAKEKKVRKTGMVLRQERESTPYKMKFRRGKVVNVQPEINIVPKRLTFRRRRVVGSSPSGKWDSQRKHRSKDGVAPKDEGNSNLGAGNVVLRHQNAKGTKKEAQGLLLNQVIEETASKLVEARKSKVKALVGAFESVISLRDSKPA